MIERQLDLIAASGDTKPADLEDLRRAAATAARRDRHRARLVRLYFVEPASDGQTTQSAFSPETTYAARQALNALFAQTSPEDAALLLGVGRGGAPQAIGLSNAAARKRLCRLRSRFADLSLNAA
jgi:hypothetical protein